MVDTVGRSAGGESGEEPETKVRTDMAAFQADLPGGPVRASKWTGQDRPTPRPPSACTPERGPPDSHGRGLLPEVTEHHGAGTQPPTQPSFAALRC